MNIFIIEDELPAREKMARMVREYDAAANIVGEVGSVREAVKLIPSVKADVILMDIQLSDGVAFEIFEQCSVDAPVIFTTTFDEYLTEAFAHNGIDYLLKPIQREKLHNAFAKYTRLKTHFAHETQQTSVEALLKQIGFVRDNATHTLYKERIIVQKGLEYLPLSVNDIAYCYTENRIVSVITMYNERYFTDKHLSDLEAELDPKHFFRLNRKYVVNIHSIQKFKPEVKGRVILELTPKPDEVVLVSQERSAAFRAWMER